MSNSAGLPQRQRSRALLPLLLVALLAVMLGIACGGAGDDDDGESDTSSSADASSGVDSGSSPEQIFASAGCAECHGASGETEVGPSNTALQGTRLIIQQFQTRVRNGKGSAMPGFTVEQISDEEIQTIYDWLSGR